MMNNENKTIHNFDFSLICEFFSNMERHDLASPEVTLKVLSFIDNLIDKSLITNVGCGRGGQTMTLSKLVKRKATSIKNSTVIHFSSQKR